MATEVKQLRSDAGDNRVRILAAARLAFTAQGASVPVREIARRADVGVATVYRHFPTKQQLYIAAFAQEMTLCSTIVEEGLAASDPWRGLVVAIEKLVTAHGGSAPQVEAIHARLSQSPEFAPDRERTVRGLLELVRRAKEAGTVRPDVGVDDIVLTMQAGRGIRTSSHTARLAATRRLAQLVIQSFRARPEPVSPPPLAGGR